MESGTDGSSNGENRQKRLDFLLPSQQVEHRSDRTPMSQAPPPTWAAAKFSESVESRLARGDASAAKRASLPSLGPIDAHVAKGMPRSEAGAPMEPAGPVEVRHDKPQRTHLPPLNVLPNEVEVQTEAARKRVRVMTTGVFDLIHLGHIHMLQAAKKLGDELVVVVARDETVRKMKHEPLNPEAVRRDIVAALRGVDRAVLGHQGDIYRIVPEVRPDIIALGYDQKFTEQEVRARCQALGMDVQVVRLPEFDHDLDSTRKIIDRITERAARKELYPNRGG